MIEDSSKHILEMKGIGKSFLSVPVLQGVQMDLHAGEVHVLAGENGAGKSTLINILGGVHTEHEGQIYLNGAPVRFKSVLDATDHGIAVIHQELSLVDSLSVVDNMFLGREQTRYACLRRGPMLRQAQDLLRELDLDIDLRCPVEHYPVGIKQMIEICKALSLQSRIMVMDEPTSALTEPEVERLFQIIAQLKQRGVGLIYITHKMEEIYRIADRITVLRDGQHIGTQRAECLPQAKLVQWMVGRDIQTQFPQRETREGELQMQIRDFCVPNPDIKGAYLVDRVSLTLRAGEIVGLAGLQGSGNSALLNGLFGSYGKTVRGEVRVGGQAYTAFDPIGAIGHGMALVTNDRKATGLVMDMNILQNVTLASLPEFSRFGWIRPRAEAKVVEAQARTLNLKTPGLTADVQVLSGGNQQKVVLAKWLATKPKVLLLDDPCRGVDIGAKHEIYELMNQLCAQGISILLVSSEMPELMFMSDRILVMHRGQVTLEANREDATPERILCAAFGQRSRV